MVLAAAPSARAEVADTKADWLKQPTSADVLGVWPMGAWRKSLSGSAKISCQVSVHGALMGCTVASETPAGEGFGAAAIALTPQFLMKPATRDGRPIVSTVNIPVNFKMPSDPSRLPSADHGGGRRSLSSVPWISAPTYSEVAAAYPRRARNEQVAGRATLSCTFKAAGKVELCQTVVEEPKGYGFSTAAKALAGRFVGPAETYDGTSLVGVSTQIPFTFAVDMLDPAKQVIGSPQWAALPSGEDFASSYPAAAAKANVGQARVVMSCQVGPEGRLAACAVQSETPAGLGFGEAAKVLSKAFQVRTWTAEGLPTIGGSVRVPIRYNLPEEPAKK